MLTRADDLPIHQTAEPVACAGTDVNFQDRYFFNGYNPDGSDFFATSFGVYPGLNIADAHFSTLRDGTQHCLHASRVLHNERMDLRVGPIAIEVIEPLRRLRLRVEGDGMAAELTFCGRAFPLELPRVRRNDAARGTVDYTSMAQNGHWTGWIDVDGERNVLSTRALGTRERSWGTHPIGGADINRTRPSDAGLFWLWSPLHFANHSVFFHVCADENGTAWNSGAVFCPEGAGPDEMRHAQPRIHVDWQDGARHAEKAELHAGFHGGAQKISLLPLTKFHMRGIGSVGSNWPHGAYKGEIAVAREDIALAGANPLLVENRHIQAVSRVTLRDGGGNPQEGIGVLEQLVLGPYAPYGFT